MDKIIIGKTSLPVKIALTEYEQEQGLMFANWPPPIMAFPFDNLQPRKFWMKNCSTPLDIVFCKDNKVIGVYAGDPLCLDFVGPDDSCNMVVEFPKGAAEKLDIVKGTNINIKYSLITLAKKYELAIRRES